MKFEFHPIAFTPSTRPDLAYRDITPADWRAARSLVSNTGSPSSSSLIGIELCERMVALRVTWAGRALLADLARRYGPLPTTLTASTLEAREHRKTDFHFFRVGDCVHDMLSVRAGPITHGLESYVRCSLIIDFRVARLSELGDVAELPTWACWLLMHQLPPGSNTYRGYPPSKTRAERGLQEMEPTSARNIAARRLEVSRSAPPSSDRLTAIGQHVAWTILAKCEPEIDRATWLVGWLLGHVRGLGLTRTDLDDPNLLDALDAMVEFAKTAKERHRRHVDVKTGSWPGRVYHAARNEIERCFNPRRRREY